MVKKTMNDIKIPFVDLKWQYAPLKNEIVEAFVDVFENSRFIMNKSVKELEEKFADIHKAKHAIAVASGTAALHAAIMALDLKDGDEVITTPFTFIATSNVIAAAGARPVFVDIEPGTFNINPQLIEEKITSKTKAIIPVHLFGQPADMDEIIKIAKKHNLRVIEDAAQAHLAEYNGKPVGTLGDMSCFSFYPAKNLGAFGEGGMILTNDDGLAKVLRQKINNGVSPEGPRYLSHTTGLNYRMNELTAAIMLKYMHKMEEWAAKRESNALYYDKELSKLSSVQIPKKLPNVRHSYHQYTIMAKKRQDLHQFLEQKGISTMVFYPMPLHLQPAYKHLGYKKGDLPHAEKASEEVLSLPIGPHLTEENLRYIVEKIKDFESASL